MTAVIIVLVVAVVVFGLAGLLVLIMRIPRGESSPPPDDEPVAIASGSEMEMSIMQATLEAAGIPSYTRNPGGVYPHSSPLYGWELLVRYGEHMEARRILNLG